MIEIVSAKEVQEIFDWKEKQLQTKESAIAEAKAKSLNRWKPNEEAIIANKQTSNSQSARMNDAKASKEARDFHEKITSADQEWFLLRDKAKLYDQKLMVYMNQNKTSLI